MENDPTPTKPENTSPEGTETPQTEVQEQEESGLFYIITKDGEETKKYFKDVLQTGDVYIKSAKLIFKLAALQRIAKLEGIVEKKFETTVQPLASNYQQHCVNVWLGFKGDNDPDNWVRGSGEASALNTGIQIIKKDGTVGFVEASKIDSRYKYAMADKRAFARALLKFIGMFSAYGDVEAKEFEELEDRAMQERAKQEAEKKKAPPSQEPEKETPEQKAESSGGPLKYPKYDF